MSTKPRKTWELKAQRMQQVKKSNSPSSSEKVVEENEEMNKMKDSKGELSSQDPSNEWNQYYYQHQYNYYTAQSQYQHTFQPPSMGFKPYQSKRKSKDQQEIKPSDELIGTESAPLPSKQEEKQKIPSETEAHELIKSIAKKLSSRDKNYFDELKVTKTIPYMMEDYHEQSSSSTTIHESDFNLHKELPEKDIYGRKKFSIPSKREASFLQHERKPKQAKPLFSSSRYARGITPEQAKKAEQHHARRLLHWQN